MRRKPPKTERDETMKETLYEVAIIAPEPWHAGLQRAYNEGILDYVESNLTIEQYEDTDEPFYSAADDQLAAYDSGYVGYGLNAHPQADQFVFSSQDSANKFQATMREHVSVAGASVVQYVLAPESDDTDPDAESGAPDEPDQGWDYQRSLEHQAEIDADAEMSDLAALLADPEAYAAAAERDWLALPPGCRRR